MSLPSQPIVLGLLGAIASGKSHVARVIASLADTRIVDADALAREALDEAARDGSLEGALGKEALGPDGRPARDAIAARVFRDGQALDRLEALIHPRVLDAIETRIDDARSEGAALVVLDAPLLLEKGIDRLCDVLWFVDVPEEVRVSRAARRGLGRDELERRGRHQKGLGEKRARADRVIRNDDGLEREIRRGLAGLGVPVKLPS